MRSMLHVTRFIAVSGIIFFILLSSCYRKGFAPSHEARTENIIIIGGDNASQKLVLRDENGNRADTFKVFAGSQIQWLLVNRDVIKEITNIYKKPSSANVFTTSPQRMGGSLNWRGTINREASGKAEEYNIDWIDTNGGKHTYDPVIKVNPR
jgi:hypothetical protein